VGHVLAAAPGQHCGPALHVLVGYSDRPMGVQLAAYLLVLAVLAIGARLTGGRPSPAPHRLELRHRTKSNDGEREHEKSNETSRADRDRRDGADASGGAREYFVGGPVHKNDMEIVANYLIGIEWRR